MMHVIELNPMRGYCVKFDYKGYEVSVSQGAFTACVFEEGSNDPLFTAEGTDGAHVKACLDYIDVTHMEFKEGKTYKYYFHSTVQHECVLVTDGQAVLQNQITKGLLLTPVRFDPKSWKLVEKA